MTRRLISSGIVSSKLRSASTWAMGICSLAATRPAATVEFTSPYTTTRPGGCSVKSCSRPVMAAAVCWAWLPEPTPRLTSGSGRPSWTKNTSDRRSS